MDRPPIRWRVAALFFTAFWLAACAPLAPEPEIEEPVEEEAPPAVLALVDRSEGFMGSGDHESAAAALERALRIAPQNADLWHRLGQVRLEQEQWSAAESLAMRSMGLDTTGALRRANWRLVADARRGAGDSAGARAAEARLGEG